MHTTRPNLLFASLLASVLAACSVDGTAGDPVGELQADSSGAATYRDVEEVLTGDDFGRWFDLKHRLRKDFDDVCGDTFCEGDYTNLEALAIRCSVSATTGEFRSCIWLFAGSYETVRPATGSIEVKQRFVRCKLPFTGAPRALLDRLLGAGDEPALKRALPGGNRSIYDVLGECLP
jgi:hypothetical protein